MRTAGCVRCGLLAVLWLVSLSACAWTADEAAQERQTIDAERAAVAARFSAAQAACTDQFLLTHCLDQPRAERQQALAALQARQLMVDATIRRERATRRLAVRPPGLAPAPLADRVEAPQTQNGFSPSWGLGLVPESPASRAGGKLATGAPRAGSSRLPARSGVPEDQAQAARDHQRHRLAFQTRLDAAQAYREAVMARNQRQSAQHPPVAGLPVPARSASIAVPPMGASRVRP